MTLYTVLEPPDGKSDHVRFVPEGFSGPAVVFTALWALWHRMWVVAALLFAIFTALNAAVQFELLDPTIGSVLQFGIAVIFGFEARQLHLLSLERTGFRRSGLIEASCLEAAELAYFAGRAPSAPPSAPARYRTAPEDTLGIFGNV